MLSELVISYKSPSFITHILYALRKEKIIGNDEKIKKNLKTFEV